MRKMIHFACVAAAAALLTACGQPAATAPAPVDQTTPGAAMTDTTTPAAAPVTTVTPVVPVDQTVVPPAADVTFSSTTEVERATHAGGYMRGTDLPQLAGGGGGGGAADLDGIAGTGKVSISDTGDNPLNDTDDDGINDFNDVDDDDDGAGDMLDRDDMDATYF